MEDMHYFSFLITLVSSIIGGCAYLRKEIKNEIHEIRNEIKELKQQGAVQAARSDRLYELYCEAKRDGDQKFYDLLSKIK